MAFVQVSVFVPEAGMNINVDMVFPNDRRWNAEAGDIKGVITLLHGFYGCGEDWIRLTAAGRYAYDTGYLLICPGAGNSFYHNMSYGPPWYDIMTQYLPRELHKIFRIPEGRERHHIAGLSMGGYGALRIGLAHPERYATIGAFSGALDLAGLSAAAARAPGAGPFFSAILGDDLFLPAGANLLTISPETAERSRALGQRIFITCGKQDEPLYHVYTQNQKFREAAHGTPLDITYREWDGGHEWQFWDRSLAEYIGFIDRSDYGDQKRGAWQSGGERPGPG
jgi:putative lysine transport system ATP-binding protein